VRLRLEIQSIPISTWGISLANRLPKDEWDKIRQEVYKDADYKCEVCGNTDDTLNCHELWRHEDKKKIQRLVGFESCCGLCHNVHHMGRSKEVYGKDYVEELIKHWCRINKKTKRQFVLYEKEIFELNKKRANIFYQVRVGRRILV